MAKPKAPASSPFDALVGARRQREVVSGSQAPEHLNIQPSQHLGARAFKQLAKSVDPEYVKFTTYIRKSTHKRLKMEGLQQGRELSELIEDLVEKWLAGGAG